MVIDTGNLGAKEKLKAFWIFWARVATLNLTGHIPFLGILYIHDAPPTPSLLPQAQQFPAIAIPHHSSTDLLKCPTFQGPR